MPSIHIQPVSSRRDRRAFVTFPWAVYRDDPNWVPPLISERLEVLDPARGPFYDRADVALFLARQGRAVVGTVAAFVDHHRNHHTGKSEGGFGFFETLNDYAVARKVLDAACAWLRAREVSAVRGPTSFTNNEYAGVLIDGANCPPAMLEAHTPPYYADFLKRYGMEKDEDLFAWRVFRAQFDGELKSSMDEIARVADAALGRANATIRKVRLENWDEEIAVAHHLFNATLRHLPNHVPMTEPEFRRTADQIRLLLDPDLALFAEMDGKPVAFGIALPDINRVLIHLNGRLFPFGWLKLRRLVRQIDGVTFKLMGVLEEYRHRGIDAMLYLAVIQAFCDKGYEWLDGSVTSEFNPMINLIAGRLGAERYKHYRLYRMAL
ncbi:MAG: N-acetyltransferase [Anaerolineae bacterium]|jgi:GNAT superfamily N-acetyltransferase